jgi:hypothetical protein
LHSKNLGAGLDTRDFHGTRKNNCVQSISSNRQKQLTAIHRKNKVLFDLTSPFDAWIESIAAGDGLWPELPEGAPPS